MNGMSGRAAGEDAARSGRALHGGSGVVRDTTIGRVIAGSIAGLWLLAGAGPGMVRAGTTGKLSGRILDAQKKPVAAATIMIVGQKLGAYSDADGNYNILNIPPGTCEVAFSRLGFKAVTVRNVVISADNTTRLDVELVEAALQMEAVVVTAERPAVDVNLTSSKTTLSDKEIEQLPVQELQDVVNLQAGVVDGHMRGGRKEEVQYQVDGVSVNNPYDNASTIRIDRSLLQEVQVISGTFDAEYGQAMSGVVNAVLKNGTDRFQWSGEIYGGGFYYDGGRRFLDWSFSPAAIQNYQLTLSGPLGKRTVYLVSGRRNRYDDYYDGQRVFVPTDTSNFEKKLYYPTGDGSTVTLGYTRGWSGLAKISNTSLENTRLSYQALVDWQEGQRAAYAWRLNPDGMTRQHTTSLVHGLDLTQTFSKTTFLDVSLRQNYLKYRDMAYDDVRDPRYFAAGPPITDDNYSLSTYIQGVDLTRYVQKTNLALLKSSLVSQVHPRHLVKVGGEIQFPNVEFGVPGYLVFATEQGVQRLVVKENEPPDYPAPRRYHPIIGAAYAQDQVEWRDLTLRAGLRLEYFDAQARVPSDPANPANAILDQPESHLEPTTPKAALAPRLGVAYPITERAGIHFAYGHFYQYPAIGQVFSNADYSVLGNLQASTVSYSVMGNPDVHAEKTVAYEFGYKQALTDQFSFDLTLFYKDIRDLLGVEFISTYNDAEYARLTNVDFGSVMGFTLSLDQRRIGPLSTTLDYTWQTAQGQSSDPRETATRAATGQDSRPRLMPLNWDQRHTLNLTATLARPDAYTVSAVLRAASGQPYTPVLDVAFGTGLEANSGRKPAAFLVDLRAERYFRAPGLNASVFGRVFNALDQRYFNGSVFSSTGSPYYSRFPVTDAVSLRDPLRFYQPRRIEVGLTLASAGE